MRPRTMFAFAVFLLVTAVAWAQEQYHSTNPDVLVRLSYERSYGAQICVSVSQDGIYRVVWLKDSLTDPTRIAGKLNDDQLLRLKKMLAGPELRSVSPHDTGIIRNHAERFAAEISRIEFPTAFKLLDQPNGQPRTPAGPPRRVQWLNADHQSPFPAPIAKLVDWMESFQTKNAEATTFFDVSQICPSVGLSFVQPSVATNTHP